MTSTTPRIVSLLPAATEMVCAVGLRERLVGVSHECSWPPGVETLPRVTRSRVDSSAGSAAIDGQVRRLAAAGEALFDLDAALVAKLQPTLIVTQAQCDVCAVSYESVVEAVTANDGLATCRVESLNPQSLDEVIDDVERIGAAGGAGEAARHAAAALRARVAAATRRPAVAGERRPRIAVIEWTDPLMIAGHWTPEMVTRAGGEYGVAAPGEPSRTITWVELAEFAPDVLIVAPCGFSLERSQRVAAILARDARWRDLPAVRRGQVVAVDGDASFSRPGPRLVDALELLSSVVQNARGI